MLADVLFKAPKLSLRDGGANAAATGPTSPAKKSALPRHLQTLHFRREKSNSTSSLYVNSTISAPNLDQVLWWYAPRADGTLSLLPTYRSRLSSSASRFCFSPLILIAAWRRRSGTTPPRARTPPPFCSKSLMSASTPLWYTLLLAFDCLSQTIGVLCCSRLTFVWLRCIVLWRAQKGPVDVSAPTQKDIYRFVFSIFKAEKLPAECAILCLAYIERLIANTKITLHGTNWRRVTLGALILASKVRTALLLLLLPSPNAFTTTTNEHHLTSPFRDCSSSFSFRCGKTRPCGMWTSSRSFPT